MEEPGGNYNATCRSFADGEAQRAAVTQALCIAVKMLLSRTVSIVTEYLGSSSSFALHSGFLLGGSRCQLRSLHPSRLQIQMGVSGPWLQFGSVPAVTRHLGREAVSSNICLSLSSSNKMKINEFLKSQVCYCFFRDLFI